jgi:hypothetical protein
MGNGGDAVYNRNKTNEAIEVVQRKGNPSVLEDFSIFDKFLERKIGKEKENVQRILHENGRKKYFVETY